MSSSCPQLQLSLQPNTTSFKRSFEQFGFDLASPVDGSEAASNERNDRNKRARSETSFSDSTDSTDGSRSSMLATTSSSSLSPLRTTSNNDIVATGMASVASFGPPRLPTPDIEDISMPDYPNDERAPRVPFSSQHEARYRLSLRSFNTLDNEDPVQQSRPSSLASLPRLPTPPPVLPPLTISEGPPFLQTSSQPASPLTGAFFDPESPSRATVQSTSPVEDSELIQGFRARLTGALERLVPQSPLVPGLELDDREEQLSSHSASNRHLLQESTEVLPQPPILPPIPSVSTAADVDHFNIEALLTGEGMPSSVVPPTSPISPSLDSHPLPSPILRDLRYWMDGQERSSADGFANPTSRHWHLHGYDPTNSSTLSHAVSFPSSQRPTEATTRVLDNSNRPQLIPEPFTQLSNQPQQTGLWGRRSLEFGSSTHDETTHSDNGTRRSSSPDLSWLNHPSRLQSAFRRRSRLGSSISLVTENSVEARRMADHDHVVRDLHAGRRSRMDDIDMALDVPRTEGIESPQDDILSRPDPDRPHAPYVLHLPPLPTPSLDVAPEEEEVVRPERDGPPPWYYGHEPRALQGVERRNQPTVRSLPESFMSSHLETGPHNPLFSQYSSPPRPTSPRRPSPPVAVLPPTNAIAWVPQNHRAPVGDAYTRRPHINLTRHLTLSHRREPPPSLPQPDFGHAFVTEGQDRDVEMGVSQQAPGQPYGPYHAYPEASSPTIYTQLQPRTHREENTSSYVWHAPAGQSLPPPQFHQPSTLLEDSSPPSPPGFSRSQRLAAAAAAAHTVQNPTLGIQAGIRPRPQQQPAENRRVLRFALPQSSEEVAGRFSSSSGTPVRISPGRMPPPPIVTSVPLYNRTENQASSPLQSSPHHHTIAEPPRYLSSGPPIVMPDNAERRWDSMSTLSSSPTTLDPAGFAPGPFRNTIHQTFYHPRLNRPPPPPIIPPLSFQEPAPGAPHFHSDTTTTPVSATPSEDFTTSRGPFTRDDPAEFNYSIRNRPLAAQNTEQQRPLPPRPFFGQMRPFLPTLPDDENMTGVGRRVVSMQEHEARLEAARLAAQEPPSNNNPSNNNAPHRRYSLPPRNDPMSEAAVLQRRQMMSFLHHHQEAERRRVAEATREAPPPQGPQANNNNNTARRFGAVDLEHLQSWRTRARGRLRITQDFLTASRMRPSNMGDFIHDDDFDDSYENLVNLAVAIGEVKPKSTPSETLEKLEIGVYKEWKTDGGDKRCPICLDDYVDHDTLLKLNNCNHWFHQNCLKQWLNTANTCPVCRKSVYNSEYSPTSPRRAGRRFGFWRGPAPPPSSGGGGGGGGGGEEGPSNRPRNNGNPGANNRWSAPLRRRFD